MNYVHDLTSTRDFSENRSFNLPKFLQLIEHNIDTSYTSPEKEVVLTGDAETRKMIQDVILEKYNSMEDEAEQPAPTSTEE